MPENSEKQNPDGSYTNKYQKHVACSYGYKVVCVANKFIKSFKSDSVKMLVTILLIIWSTKVRIVLILLIKYFDKELLMIQKNNKDFKNPTKYWSCDILLCWRWC